MLRAQVVHSRSEEDARLVGHSGAVRCLLTESASQRLFAGSADGTISVWDLEDLRLLTVLLGHTRPVVALVFHEGLLFSVAGRRARLLPSLLSLPPLEEPALAFEPNSRTRMLFFLHE